MLICIRFCHHSTQFRHVICNCLWLYMYDIMGFLTKPVMMYTILWIPSESIMKCCYSMSYVTVSWVTIHEASTLRCHG